MPLNAEKHFPNTPKIQPMGFSPSFQQLPDVRLQPNLKRGKLAFFSKSHNPQARNVISGSNQTHSENYKTIEPKEEYETRGAIQ